VGYSTSFEGEIRIEPTLRPVHRAYLQRFAETRRMKRDPRRAERLSDPLRVAADLPIGAEGAYFVGSDDDFSDTDPSVIDGDTPHAPFSDSLYCDWTPSGDGSALGWNGREKFYEYVRWLEFLIEHFLGPWRYRLLGRIDWQGDDPDDRGSIFVTDNAVRAVEAETRRTDLGN
jgi:hypothetical protein